jgi:SAM-dependent methyltransferase
LYSADLAFVHDAGFGELAAHTAPEIVHVLHAHGIRDGRIVELGCGSGITARHLAAAGFEVLGIDASPAMIELARANAPRAQFRVASIETADVPVCRAVVAIGEVVSYVPGGLPALRRMFARIHGALAPGGLLLFDFIDSAAARTYRAKSSGGVDWALVSSARFDKSRRVLTRRIIVVRRLRRRLRRADETHRVRVYRRAEMRCGLVDAGFSVRLQRSYGTYRLPAGDVVAVARVGPTR